MAESVQSIKSRTAGMATGESQGEAKPVTAGKRQDEWTKEIARRRKRKNWALFAALMGFVVLVYFVSLVRMSLNTP